MTLENQALHLQITELEAQLAEARAEVERAKAACQRLGDEVSRVTGEAVKYATDIVILKNAMKSARISMLWCVGHLSRLGLETEAELVRCDADRLAEAAGLDQPTEAPHA